MKCPICNHETHYIEDFKPYVDMEWIFPLYDCFTCRTRFAVRDFNINYHEILYDKRQDSSYGFYYTIGKNVKNYLDNGEIEECEKYLRKNKKYSNLIDFIYKNADKQSRILEIGCSTGFITAFLRRKGYFILGIDISKTAVEAATELFGEYYSEIKDFQNEKMDLIIHCGMIGCIDNPKSFLEMYLNLLNNNGKMYFNSPYLERVFQSKEKWCSTLPPDLIYLYSEKSFEFLINKNVYSLETQIEYEKNTFLVYLRKFIYGYLISYSRSFINKNEAKPEDTKKLSTLKESIKYFLGIMNRILIITGLLKKLPQEYGMYITINKL